MAPPTFPTELLAEIVRLVAQAPDFDFVQSDWAAGVEYATLRALCLTSRVLNELATPHLYRHLVLPTAEAGRALVRTVRSAKWSSGGWNSKTTQLVKAVSVGRPVEYGSEAEGWFAHEVFDVLRHAWVQRVAVVGLKIGLEALAVLRCEWRLLARPPRGHATRSASDCDYPSP